MSENRIHVVIDLAEKHSRPNIALTITDAHKKEISHSIIMGTIENHVEFTMHLRVLDPCKPLIFTCTTYSEEDKQIDSKSIEIMDRS